MEKIKIPSHLPKRLTISFPIWLLFGYEPDSPYYDLDKVMTEHKERGFNCIRFEDGAGLLFDKNGNKIPPLKLRRAFGKYDVFVRQMQGREGLAENLTERLIKICEAAKRHGMTLVLSTWYYLHTFWRVDNDRLNDSLFGIPDHEVFSTFALFLDQILTEIKAKGLSDTIAFCEIMNEADGLTLVGGYGNAGRLPESELILFRADHEKALDWLRKKHPDILFAYDSYTPNSNEFLIPSNLQVFNFHNYFAWSIYGKFRTEVGKAALLPYGQSSTEADVMATRDGQRPAAKDWYERVAYYASLSPERLPATESWFMETFEKDYNFYIDKLSASVERVKEFSSRLFPGAPIVTAEGVSYPESTILLWEEHCPLYWDMLLKMADIYRDAGFWGMTPRTCSGPEDPSWNLNKKELLAVNTRFLEG